MPSRDTTLVMTRPMSMADTASQRIGSEVERDWSVNASSSIVALMGALGTPQMPKAPSGSMRSQTAANVGTGS